MKLGIHKVHMSFHLVQNSSSMWLPPNIKLEGDSDYPLYDHHTFVLLSKDWELRV